MLLFEVLPLPGALPQLAGILHFVRISYPIAGGILKRWWCLFCRVLLIRDSLCREQSSENQKRPLCAPFWWVIATPHLPGLMHRDLQTLWALPKEFSFSWSVLRMRAASLGPGGFSKLHCPCARGSAVWICDPKGRDTAGRWPYVFPAAVNSCEVLLANFCIFSSFSCYEKSIGRKRSFQKGNKTRNNYSVTAAFDIKNTLVLQKVLLSRLLCHGWAE